jgi:hypothetical protein
MRKESIMHTTTILLIVIPVAIALIVGGFFGVTLSRRQRSKRL